MTVLFLKVSGGLDSVSAKIFRALDVSDHADNDSLNARGGHYTSYKVFGCELTLEENSYDYEDIYDYTLFVKKNPLSDIVISARSERLVAELLADLLKLNLNLQLLVE